MKYNLAIFDLDGTILDTLDDLTNSVNHALRTTGYPTRIKGDIRSFLGHGAKYLIAGSLGDVADQETIDTVLGYFREHYDAHCTDSSVPYAGITGLFKSLRQHGYKIAVISNKPDYAVHRLCQKHFTGMLDYIAGETKGVPKKPAPDAVNTALATLNAEPFSSVYIGDSEVDIATAENAEIDGIIVDWGFRDHAMLVTAGAEIIVSSPEELMNILLA